MRTQFKQATTKSQRENRIVGTKKGGEPGFIAQTISFIVLSYRSQAPVPRTSAG